LHFSIPIHNSSSVFTGSIAGRRGRELVAQVCTALGSLRPRQTRKQAQLAAIAHSPDVAAPLHAAGRPETRAASLFLVVSSSIGNPSC